MAERAVREAEQDRGLDAERFGGTTGLSARSFAISGPRGTVVLAAWAPPVATIMWTWTPSGA